MARGRGKVLISKLRGAPTVGRGAAEKKMPFGAKKKGGNVAHSGGRGKNDVQKRPRGKAPEGF